MAVSSSFKQKCPSCEAMVSIKDPSLVGKKVECSKCKYRFVVESPIEQDKAAVKKAHAEEDGETNGKNGNGAKAKNGAAAKTDPKKRFKDEDLEEHDEKPAKAKAGAAAKKQRDEDDDKPQKGKKEIVDDDDEQEQPKSGAPLKLVLGLGLAFVGVSVLAVAAWLLLSGGGGGSTAPKAPGGAVTPTLVNNAPESKGGDGDKLPVEEKKEVATGPGPEQTNLLPNDTEHVLHLFMKDLFDSGGALRDAVFQADGSLANVNFKKRLGFDLLDIADIVRGERYSAPAWSMAVLFLTEPVDEKGVVAALGLKKSDPIKNQVFYEATKPNPTFERLAGFTFGVPHKLRLVAARGERKLFVRFHNAHTIVVGDHEPVQALLRAEGHFKELTARPTPQAPAPQNNGPGLGQPGFGQSMPGSPGPPPGSAMPGSGSPGPPPGSAMPGSGSPPPPPPGSPMPGSGSPGPPPPGSPMPGGGSSGPPGSPMPGGGSLGPPPPGSPMPGGGGGLPINPGSVSGGFGPQPGTPAPGGATPGSTPGGTSSAPPPVSLNPREEMYLTINKNLKAALDRLEHRLEGSKERVLFSSVTDLRAAHISPSGPEWKNLIVRIPRELWDVTYLLEERRASLSLLGAALMQKDTRVFSLRNDLTCVQEGDAKDHYKHLMDKGAPQVARFFEKLFDHKVQLPKEEVAPDFNPNGPMGPMGPMGPGGNSPGPGSSGPRTPGLGSPRPGGGSTPGPGRPGLPSPGGMPNSPAPGGGGGGSFKPPGAGGGFNPGGFNPGGFNPGGAAPEKPKKDEPSVSRITLSHNDATVEFTLDLVLDKGTFDRLLQVATLTAGMLRVEIDLASRILHDDLAQAAKRAAEKGMTEVEPPVVPGQYPPGAFQPLEAGNRRSAFEPQNRISWMAAMLPHLGQESVYNRINFRHSWRDPNNWLAGQAVVPQFLDPRYPAATRQVSLAGVPIEYGASHFVAIAGVGLDAPTYPRDDPAYIAKRGIFGYDKSATLKEVQQGRGLANTIAFMQIPHDGTAGVNPWMAGGGANMRGVPEKNSIAPFVLSTDKFGKVIQHNGKRGTYAGMADGSVRFVDQNVSDEVFKAMCRIGGGAPEDFEAQKNKYTTPVKFPKDEIIPEEPFIRPKSAPKPAPTEATPVPKGWIVFNAPEGYSVALPHQPKAISQPVPTGGTMTLNMALQLDKQMVFMAAAMAIPEAELKKGNKSDWFREMAKGMAMKGGQIQGETRVTLGKYEGREFLLDMPLPEQLGGGTQRATVRVYIANQKVVLVLALTNNPAAVEVRAFFDSLKIKD